MKIVFSDILKKTTNNAHFLLYKNVIDCILKFTYVLSRYGKTSKASQEVIF